jgi:predicted nucleotidyltransferase
VIPEQVRAAARLHRYPLIFATVSGAHLYGFPSPDSDWDLRGVHVLPPEQVVGLLPLEETLQLDQDDVVELDLVTHDIRKFFKLLLRPNGYVLEQLLSPIVVHTTPEHEEVMAVTPKILTRHHAHHYLGFADTQWRLFDKEEQPRIKPLLNTFRVLLTGIHLMRTGAIEANLGLLNQIYKLPFLPDLIARKVEGAEQQTVAPNDVMSYAHQFEALRERLVMEASRTSLPEAPTAQAALNDILIRVRLGTRA